MLQVFNRDGPASLELDLTFFLFAVPAVIFAGVSKGGFGSGAAFAATPLLALILEPALATGLMLPLLILMDVGGLRAYWKQWDWDASRALILGSVPGIIAGALLFKIASPDLFRFMIGAIAIAFVLFQLAVYLGWIRRAARPIGDLGGQIAGAVAGFTSFISHAGGPPAAIYLLSRNMTKTSFQATTVITFSVINVLKFGPYVAIGLFTTETFWACLYLSPVALFGVWLGVKAHHFVSETLFFFFTYVFLLVTGTKLIFDALA